MEAKTPKGLPEFAAECAMHVKNIYNLFEVGICNREVDQHAICTAIDDFEEYIANVEINESMFVEQRFALLDIRLNGLDAQVDRTTQLVVSMLNTDLHYSEFKHVKMMKDYGDQSMWKTFEQDALDWKASAKRLSEQPEAVIKKRTAAEDSEQPKKKKSKH